MDGPAINEGDLRRFRRDLLAATPRVVVTPLLAFACVLIFAGMEVAGGPCWDFPGDQLIRWGANSGVRVSTRHEYWRLLTGIFVHGGLIHLAVNLWCLLAIGPLVERLFGNLGFTALYFAAGLGGSLASVAMAPGRVSVGASGAIFGVLGGLVAFLVIHRRTIPATVLRPLLKSAMGFVVFNTIFGIVVPRIDQSAHLGGLTSGFLAGLALSRPWPAVRQPAIAARRFAAGVGLFVLMGAGSVSLAGWTARRLTPLDRLQEFLVRTEPAVRAFSGVEILLGRTLPDSDALASCGTDPRRRREVIRELVMLIPFAESNRDRLRQTGRGGVSPAYEALEHAQAHQCDALRAALYYLETCDPDWLTGPRGFLTSRRLEWDCLEAYQAGRRPSHD
jgi:rhomboid protease GluP